MFGRVQGVFFRKYTRDEAIRIGSLNGFVRNLRDGSVEIVVEGHERKIQGLIEWCRSQGSPWSSVKNVEVVWSTYIGDLSEFRTVY